MSFVSDTIRTVLEAEDDTSAAFQSAARNHRNLQAAAESTERAIAKAARRTGVSIDEYKAKMEQTKRALQEQARAAEQAARAIDHQGGAARSTTTSLAAMAGRYIGVAAAVDLARRSFQGFGETDFLLRKMQVQSGDTAKTIEGILPPLKRLSRDLKIPLDDLINGFDMVRERGRLSVAETASVFPRIAAGAKGMTVEVKEMADVYGTLMSNLKIGGGDAVKVMDMLQAASEDYQLEASELVRSLPKLSNLMREWGMTGVDGVQRMLAHIAVLRPAFTSTAEAAEALTRILVHPDNEKIANKIGRTTRAMMDILRKAGAEGKDVVAMYLGMLEEAQKNGLRMEDIETRQRNIIIAMKAGLIDRKKAYDEIGASVGRVDRATKIMTEGAKASWQGMSVAAQEAGYELGKLLDSLGASKGLRGVADLLEGMSKAVDNISAGFGKIQGFVNKMPESNTSRQWKNFQRDLRAGRTQPWPRDLEMDSPATVLPPEGLTGPRPKLPPLFPGGGLRGGAIQKMSYDPGLELRSHTGKLAEIAELLRQLRDRAGDGEARVMNAAYSPGGGGVFRGGRPGGGSFSGPGGGAAGTPFSGGGGRFNGLGVSRPGPGGGAAPGGGAPGAGGGAFMDALADAESGNRNIHSQVDPDVSGPGTRSQGYFQINTPTWRDFAPKAGIDLNQYPNAMSAPRELQAQVAKVIPFGRFGPRTRRMLEQRFGPLDRRTTVGDHATRLGGSSASATPGAGGGAAESHGGKVTERQKKVAQYRTGDLDPRLRSALDYASAKTGLEADVTSGGQRMPGARGATGSHRHDGGKAGDFNLRDAKGNVIGPNDPRAIEFYRHAAAAGVTGGGAGYMRDPNKIHLDIDSERYRSPVYAGSPAFRAAIARGKAERPEFLRQQAERMKKEGAPAGYGRMLGGGAAAGPGPGTKAPQGALVPDPGDRGEPDGGVAKAREIRAELSQPITINARMEGAERQFRRSSINREVNRETREARWDSYSDIGAA